MSSEEAPYTVSQNDGLFLHPALTAPTYRTFQRSYHLYVHHGEKHGGLRITGTPDEISGTPDPLHPDLGHVYGTVRLYAQY